MISCKKISPCSISSYSTTFIMAQYIISLIKIQILRLLPLKTASRYQARRPYRMASPIRKTRDMNVGGRLTWRQGGREGGMEGGREGGRERER